LFDAHRRAPVDLYEKFLDFLDVDLLRMLFIKLKNIFWWERNNFLAKKISQWLKTLFIFGMA
jgi:hypothetical protein